MEFLKKLFAKRWFQLAVPVLVFILTAAGTGYGMLLLFPYFVLWLILTVKEE